MTDWWIILGILLVLIIVSLLVIIAWQRRELFFHKLQQKELDNYTTEVESIYRQMRGIRHDYRNHLQVMEAYIETTQYSELKDYILQMTNELNQVDTIIRTGNTLIDALVNTKLSYAKERGVQLNTKAIAPANLGLDNVDLAVILGNLLNNAVEATTRSSHHSRADANSKQFIRLYIAPIKNNLYISVTNTMHENPKPSFISLKAPDRKGYGIWRIDRAVEKYQGIINRQWEDGVFATEITIPLVDD